MNIQEIFESLTKDEKMQLSLLLKKENLELANCSLQDFFDNKSNQKIMSARLCNILYNGLHQKWQLLSLSELTFEKFKEQRNAGRKSWLEFVELRGF